MTEILMPVIADRFRKMKPAKRREILDGLAERLHPLNKGAIGLIIDKNDLEAAFNVIERVNQKAYNEYREKYKAVPAGFKPKFIAPFYWSPNDPQKQQAQWGSMLKEAFSAYL